MGALLTTTAAKKAAGQAALRMDMFSLRDHAQSYFSAEIKALSEEQVRDVRGHFLVPVPLSCLVRHGSFSCLVVFVVVIVWLVLQPNTRSYENEAGDVVLTKHMDPVIPGWWLSPTCSARCRHNSTPSRLASTSLPAMQESGPDEKEEAVRDS
jgi:hypothetical protein